MKVLRISEAQMQISIILIILMITKLEKLKGPHFPELILFTQTKTKVEKNTKRHDPWSSLSIMIPIKSIPKNTNCQIFQNFNFLLTSENQSRKKHLVFLFTSEGKSIFLRTPHTSTRKRTINLVRTHKTRDFLPLPPFMLTYGVTYAFSYAFLRIFVPPPRPHLRTY